MIKTIFLFTVIGNFIGIQPGFCQFKNYNTESEFIYPGTIKLLDGEVIIGNLNYIFVSGVVTNIVDTITYGAEQVLFFELKDEESQSKQQFYSLPYDVNNSGRNGAVFFEVLHENKQVAILSRHYVETKQRKRRVGAAVNGVGGFIPMNQRKEKVFQEIYIATKTGQIWPYLKVRKSTSIQYSLKQHAEYSENRKYEESKTDKEVSNYRITNDKVISDLCGRYYDDVQDFRVENNYQLNRVEDLILILDYYADIK